MFMLTSRLSALSMVCALVALTSCTNSHANSASGHSTGGAKTTTCGGTLLEATSGNRTWPLLSCAGLADVNPLPTPMLKVGDVLTVRTGERQAHLTLAGGPAVAIDGLRVVAQRAGSTLVTVTGWPCYVSTGVPPKACPLMRINIVSGAGALEGFVLAYGGPANAQGKGLSGQRWGRFPVSVRSSGGKSFRTATDANGHFRLSLPADTYTFTSLCGMSAKVVLTAGSTVTHDLKCPLA